MVKADDNRYKHSDLVALQWGRRRKHMNKEMAVNGKSYTIIKLLGKGKGGYS